MKMTCAFRWEVCFATDHEPAAADLNSLSSPGWINHSSTMFRKDGSVKISEYWVMQADPSTHIRVVVVEIPPHTCSVVKFEESVTGDNQRFTLQLKRKPASTWPIVTLDLEGYGAEFLPASSLAAKKSDGPLKVVTLYIADVLKAYHLDLARLKLYLQMREQRFETFRRPMVGYWEHQQMS